MELIPSCPFQVKEGFIMRKVIALLLLICLIFTMTGCSQKENTASGPVTITVWHDKEDAVIAVLEEAVPEITR